MKTAAVVKSDPFIYAVLFAVWALLVYSLNMKYEYFGKEFPSVAFEKQSPQAVQKSLTDAIVNSRRALASEKNREKQCTIAAAVGATYFQIFAASNNALYRDSSETFCVTALRLDSTIGVAHYLLGEIALSKSNQSAAVSYYEKEASQFATSSLGVTPNGLYNAKDPTTRMAAMFSNLRLAFLYSTAFVDGQKAQGKFNAYLSLETDPQRRQSSVQQIQKYWKTQTK